MPVSGFKKGDRVTTPSGRRAIVVWTKQSGIRRCTVEFSDGTRQGFDMRALRYEENR